MENVHYALCQTVPVMAVLWLSLVSMDLCALIIHPIQNCVAATSQALALVIGNAFRVLRCKCGWRGARLEWKFSIHLKKERWIYESKHGWRWMPMALWWQHMTWSPIHPLLYSSLLKGTTGYSIQEVDEYYSFTICGNVKVNILWTELVGLLVAV